MKKKAVVDSGPLIALFDKDDSWHRHAVEFIKRFDGALVSNCAVITEVTHLLDFNVQTQIAFIEWVVHGAVTVVDISMDDLERILELTRKYADVPMDFADASLVALCERLAIRDVVSVDRDFAIYRTREKKGFRNLFFAR